MTWSSQWFLKDALCLGLLAKRLKDIVKMCKGWNPFDAVLKYVH